MSFKKRHFVSRIISEINVKNIIKNDGIALIRKIVNSIILIEICQLAGSASLIEFDKRMNFKHGYL
jgi:hypothetical protein